MTLTVVDMHTGGEPLRIVTGGYPRIHAVTLAEECSDPVVVRAPVLGSA